MNTLDHTGSIDNRYAIVMQLKTENGKVSGSYRYAKSKTSLILDGTVDGTGKVQVKEKDSSGKITGAFTGKLVPGKRFVGTWADAKKAKTLPFLAAVDGTSNALDYGIDGIIITQQVQKVPKPKRDGQQQEPAIITVPIVAQKFLPETVGPKIQKLLSTKNVLKQSPEEMIATIRGGDLWLEDVNYTINYNKNGLVDADFAINGCGAYPDGSISHILIDLKTASAVTAKNAFITSSLPKLKSLIKAKMQSEVSSTLKEFEKSPEELESLKEQFAEKPVAVSDDVINNFSVSDKGLTFTHDWNFPHVVQALEPDGKYFFSFADLKPFILTTGPLGQFVR